MAGRLGEAGLGDHGVRRVLDLCLECRACKAECPVGVDMARFKSEFLADYWKRHGTPLRARVLGHVHQTARWGSRLAPLSNAVARSAVVRWLNDAILGLDRRRKPPRWAHRTFVQEFQHLASSTEPFVSSPDPPAPPRVLLFVDTFTNYYNPAVGMAAAVVLKAAGFRVELAPNRCCGRPLISQGLLQEARRRAAANTDRLHAPVAAGARLVFLEPSCLSAVREDVPSLLRGDAQRRAAEVARHAVLFEELLEERCRSDARALTLRAGPDTVLLHGHCHQKAMGLVAPALALLSRIPGASVVDLDAGCCGMAGSFGYAREHFDVSRTIGERRLLPAARTMGAGSVLVASGVSCRHQVEDFTGVEALHPAQLLRSLLATP
jgi:Fe-S oxidoreductase